MAPGVGATTASYVLTKSFLYVFGDAGIETPALAEEDVDEV